jgi:hypothetical protein
MMEKLTGSKEAQVIIGGLKKNLIEDKKKRLIEDTRRRFYDKALNFLKLGDLKGAAKNMVDLVTFLVRNHIDLSEKENKLVENFELLRKTRENK